MSNPHFFTNRFEVNAMTQQEIVKIRDMIRKNEKAYHNNKIQVDKIYRDYLANAVEAERIQEETIALNAILGNVTGTVSARAQDVVLKERKKEKYVYDWNMERQMCALEFLLEGKETGNYSIDMYLNTNYSIYTDNYNRVQKKIEDIQQLKEQGKSDQEIKSILAMRKTNKVFHDGLYARADELLELRNRELEELRARAQAEGRDPEQDPQIQCRERVLSFITTRIISGGSVRVADGASALRTISILESEEAMQQHVDKQNMFFRLCGKAGELTEDEAFTYTKEVTDEKTGEKKLVKHNKYDADVLRRDIVSVASPVGKPGECGIERAAHLLDNTNIIERVGFVVNQERESIRTQAQAAGETLKEEELEARTQKSLMDKTVVAVSEEADMMEATVEELDAYVAANGGADDLLKLPEVPTIEWTARVIVVMQPVFEKMRGTLARVDSIVRKDYFIDLPMELQIRIKQVYPAVAAYKHYSEKIKPFYHTFLENSEDTCQSFEEHKEHDTKTRDKYIQMGRAAWEKKELKRAVKINSYIKPESVSIVRALKEKREKIADSSRKLYETMEKSEKRVNSRLTADFMKGYYADAQGNPLTEEDAQNKVHDERVLKAFYGSDTALTKEFMEGEMEFAFQVRLTPEMMEEDYIISHALEITALVRRFLMMDNWIGPHREIYDSMPEEKRNRLDDVRNAMTSVCNYVTHVLASIGVTINDRGAYEGQLASENMIAMMPVFKEMIPDALERLQRANGV